MKRQLILWINLFFSFCLMGQGGVFPGDANANGVVDQYDVLSIGFAIGETGPARILTDNQTETQSIPVNWDMNFPNGLNMIHADADGNGSVNVMDFFPWDQNFGFVHAAVTPIELPDDSGAEAQVLWNNGLTIEPVTAAQQLNIPFEFIIPDNQNVNGIAYRLSYNPEHFAHVDLSVSNTWLVTDGQGIALENAAPGAIDVGVSRFGPNPLFGGGTGGTLELIIIDDMIGLLETAPDTLETHFKLEQVLLVNDELEPIPIRSDSFSVKLYRPGTVASADRPQDNELEAVLFPNPFQGQLNLRSTHPMQRVLIYDTLGREVWRKPFSPRRQLSVQDLQLASGCYFIQIEGKKGISQLRLVVP